MISVTLGTPASGMSYKRSILSLCPVCGAVVVRGKYVDMDCNYCTLWALFFGGEIGNEKPPLYNMGVVGPFLPVGGENE